MTEPTETDPPTVYAITFEVSPGEAHEVSALRACCMALDNLADHERMNVANFLKARYG